MKLKRAKLKPVISEKKAETPFIDERPNKYANSPFILVPNVGRSGPGGANPLFRPRDDLKWNIHTDGVTYSLLSTFLQCPEKLKLQYGKRLSGRRTSGALAFGSVFHEALDQIYTYKKDTGFYPSIGGVLAQMEERDTKKLKKGLRSPTALMDLQENYGMAEVVLEAYMKKWEREHNAFGDWIALEEKFNTLYRPSIQLGLDIPDIPLRGKRDGVFLCQGVPWLFETKTKGRIEDESIMDTLGFNLQNHLYMYTGAIDHGKTFGGVLYNLVRRPQLKMGVKDTLRSFLQRIRDDIEKRPEFYFIRYNLTSTSQDQRKWKKEFDGIMWRLIMWYYGQYHYRDNSACSGRMGVCEYLPICGNRNIGTNAYIERPSVFPELDGDE
jgi:hypothetical protein